MDAEARGGSLDPTAVRQHVGVLLAIRAVQRDSDGHDAGLNSQWGHEQSPGWPFTHKNNSNGWKVCEKHVTVWGGRGGKGTGRTHLERKYPVGVVYCPPLLTRLNPLTHVMLALSLARQSSTMAHK